MHAKGSLKETALRSLLEGAQSERATGTLTVKNNGQSYTLYFLFGHLFHATGEGATGDDAVLGALRWDDGESHAGGTPSLTSAGADPRAE